MPNYNTTLQTNNSSLEEIITQLNNMPDAGEGDLDTSDATATSGDILSGKTAYVDGEKITGTITTKTSSNLTVNGATVTVPAGYYSAQTTKSVSTATQATPSITINSSTGLITASATQNAGYVAAGTKNNTKQLTTQAAKTITPSISSQTAVAKNVYTTGVVTVGAIPSNYEDVGTETSTYTTKLASLETAITALETELEGKASGGSGGTNVETCAVIINHPYTTTGNYIERYFITTYVDENYSSEFYDHSLDAPSITTTSITINNVVCGTQLCIYSGIDSRMWGYSLDKAEIVSHFTGRFIIKITANAGETATINIYDDD